MRRLNSDLSDNSNEKWKTPYLDIIAVGTIQFFLSLLILCYGVFLMQFILEDFCNLKTSLWTAICFVAAYKITNPCAKSYCKHLDNVKRKIHKRNIIVTVFLLFADLILVAFSYTPITVIIFYGIFGGIFSSIIYVHVDFATSEVFKHHPDLFSILDQIAKSFCLLFMPLLIFFLTEFYSAKETFFILGAIILNIIPACLLIRTKKRRKVRLCKFQTTDKLAIEMTELSPRVAIDKESSSSSDEDDDDEETEEEREKEDDDDKSSPVSATNSVQKYFQNVGVNILPNIPEESDLENDDDINEISSKRLSRISQILQEINENTHRNVNLSINNLYQPEEFLESIESDSIETEFNESSQKKSRCFSISSCIISELKVKKRRIKSLFYGCCVRSIPAILGTLYFYPILISTCIITTLSSIIFATVPYLMILKNDQKVQNNSNPLHTPQESAFSLTVIGFTWLFFSAGFPVFNKLTSLKTKVLFLLGLATLGFSLLIVHKFSYDNFMLFSLMFGLGYGIVSYMENIANENFCGKPIWKMLQGTLEISTGIIVILIYLVIYFSNVEIYVLLSYAYWIYFFNVGLWTVMYLTKKVYDYFKNSGRYNLNRYPEFDL